MNPPPFSLTNAAALASSNDANSIIITPGNQNQVDNLPLPNYHDASASREGDATHDAAILLTSIKNLAHKEIACKPRSVSINLPSIPDLEKHFKRSSSQQGIHDVDQGIDASFVKCTPRTLGVCLTSVLNIPGCDTSRIRTVSMDSHQSEHEVTHPLTPVHQNKIVTQHCINTSSSQQIVNSGQGEAVCVSPSLSLSSHVIPTDIHKSPKRNVDRRKRYLDAHKEDEEEEQQHDEKRRLVECQDVVATEAVPPQKKPHTKKQKVSTKPPRSTTSKVQDKVLSKAQVNVQDSSGNAKAILKKKFSWKNYPELENFLIANREEYLRHSALNYTMEQKQYNNRLTERLIELASECGYVFDQNSFTFVSIRDRIRCYFKSYVQSRKKRGVIIGYAARKAGLLDERQLEKNAGSKAKIISVSNKQRGKKL